VEPTTSSRTRSSSKKEVLCLTSPVKSPATATFLEGKVVVGCLSKISGEPIRFIDPADLANQKPFANGRSGAKGARGGEVSKMPWHEMANANPLLK
jgi:hypothetical protein